jgi:23S rRNA (guanosine2251-2'-O)-methyltransferase
LNSRYFGIYFVVKKLTHQQIASKRLIVDGIDEDLRLPVVVVVESIRSLYNVGSIFRTSDGALIRKLVLTGFSPYPPRKEIEKTALGSTKSVPWEYVQSPLQAVTALKTTGYKVCCLELTDSGVPYSSLEKSDFPLCLVLGNEITGVSKDVLGLCETALEIPMYGTKQSLNVAVAYGIAVFELSRIWRNN